MGCLENGPLKSYLLIRVKIAEFRLKSKDFAAGGF